MYTCTACGESAPAMHTLTHGYGCPGTLFSVYVTVQRDTYAHTGYECGAL